MFGKKDYQQLFIIRSMVEQLNLPVRIVAGETRREADGLAMSSRNQYLSASRARPRGGALEGALSGCRQRSRAVGRTIAELETEGRNFLDRDGFRVDYVALRKSRRSAVPDRVRRRDRWCSARHGWAPPG